MTVFPTHVRETIKILAAFLFSAVMFCVPAYAADTLDEDEIFDSIFRFNMEGWSPANYARILGQPYDPSDHSNYVAGPSGRKAKREFWGSNARIQDVITRHLEARGFVTFDTEDARAAWNSELGRAFHADTFASDWRELRDRMIALSDADASITLFTQESALPSIDCKKHDNFSDTLFEYYGIRLSSLEKGATVDALNTGKVSNNADIRVGDRLVLVGGTTRRVDLALYGMCGQISLYAAFERDGEYTETILSPGAIHRLDADLTDFPVPDPFRNKDGSLDEDTAKAWSDVFNGETSEMSTEEKELLLVFGNTAVSRALGSSERFPKDKRFFENFQGYRAQDVPTCFPYGADEINIKTTTTERNVYGSFLRETVTYHSVYYDPRYTSIMKKGWDDAPRYGNIYRVIVDLVQRKGCTDAAYLKFYNQMLQLGR